MWSRPSYRAMTQAAAVQFHQWKRRVSGAAAARAVAARAAAARAVAAQAAAARAVAAQAAAARGLAMSLDRTLVPARHSQAQRTRSRATTSAPWRTALTLLASDDPAAGLAASRSDGPSGGGANGAAGGVLGEGADGWDASLPPSADGARLGEGSAHSLLAGVLFALLGLDPACGHRRRFEGVPTRLPVRLALGHCRRRSTRTSLLLRGRGRIVCPASVAD